VTIKAPISGTIVDRKIGPGQYIKADAPDPLFLISDLSTVWVVADVFESDLLQLRNRAPVEIHIDAYPGRTFPAQVSFISPSVDPATHTVRVRCLVHNADGALKPDMFARIRIRSAAEERVAVVPAAAVISEGDRSVVFLEQEPGRFCRREIHVDRKANGLLVVRDGLRSGDRIVTRGALLLNEVSKPEG
jgi:cobalt-zinc-cadmium efflux system membrane fusion protein